MGIIKSFILYWHRCKLLLNLTLLQLKFPLKSFTALWDF